MSTNFMITGIKKLGLILLVGIATSCECDDCEPGAQIRTEYRFINTLGDSIVLKGYVLGIDNNWVVTLNKPIQPKDSLINHTEWSTVDKTSEPLPVDSVVIEFANGTCTGYRGPLKSSPDLDGNQGLFNVNNYRNYQRGMFAGEFSNFYLSYDIGARDTLLAVPCP